ncbi:MAG: nicotinate-nucleotide adenylyltransferase [Acidobacteriota bacterium]
MGNRTGIFSGTFDPIHLGHLRAAEVSRKCFSLDRIIFIPSYLPPHKETEKISPPLDRFIMVSLAIHSNAHFIPSSLEIERGGISYTIDTLNKLQENFPEDRFYFLIGDDAFSLIETWKDYKTVIKSCSFLILSRPGYEKNNILRILNKEKGLEIKFFQENEKFESKNEIYPAIYIFTMDSLNISSTEIREKVRKKLSIKYLVPDEVESYIIKNNLYSEV